jgi:hypothetical protein
MFWVYRPPFFTFPTMRLEALSALSARMLKVLLLAAKAPISIPGIMSLV